MLNENIFPQKIHRFSVLVDGPTPMHLLAAVVGLTRSQKELKNLVWECVQRY